MKILQNAISRLFPVKEVLPPRNPNFSKSLLGRLNPIWALFGNDDDFGTLGDPWWNPPVYKKMVLNWKIVNVRFLGPMILPSIELQPQPDSVNWPRWRKFHWWARNPAHNFCFYTIGISDCHRTFYGTAGWREVEGWTFHFTPTPTLKFPLPLISYKGRLDFYIGWRPYGSFGIAMRRRKKIE